MGIGGEEAKLFLPHGYESVDLLQVNILMGVGGDEFLFLFLFLFLEIWSWG